MTSWQVTILFIYGCIVAAWPVRHLVLSLLKKQFHFLDLKSPPYNGPSSPRVTAIIPAKDEEAHIAECLASVQAQSYPNLEILVVDDRSSDGTAVIAEAIASRDPRVRVLRNHELPPGWTGKPYALHIASQAAQGDWFWFLDADTRHVPSCLSICMEYGRQQGAALVSLIPEMRCDSFWEAVVQPLAGIVLMRSFPPPLVNRDRNPLAFANGQFLLIKREAYEQAGGHAAVRDRFVEDIYLAKRVKHLGFPIRVAMGPSISSTRMYASLPQLIRGWSRILYDALGRKVAPLIAKILEPLIFSQTFFLALLWGLILLFLGKDTSFAWWLVGLALLHLALQISVLYRMYGWSSPSTAKYAFLYPLAGLVSDVILLRAIQSCLTGKVHWRGTSYGANQTQTASSSAK
jgi:glycosyltransferase involved in cell wall biosynthesis